MAAWRKDRCLCTAVIVIRHRKSGTMTRHILKTRKKKKNGVGELWRTSVIYISKNKNHTKKNILAFKYIVLVGDDTALKV